MLIENTYWIWLSLGVFLMILEMLMPGVFMLWIGFAAIFVSLITFIQAPSLLIQISLFAGLSILLSWVGQKMWQKLTPAVEESPLNRRGAMLIGHVFILNNPLIEGKSQLKVGDSVWTVIGPDLPQGTRVKITGVEGNALIVEKIED